MKNSDHIFKRLLFQKIGNFISVCMASVSAYQLNSFIVLPLPNDSSKAVAAHSGLPGHLS